MEDRVNSLRSMTTDEFVGMFGERIVYLTSLSYVRMLSCMYQITGYRGSHIYADLRNEASCKLACKIMDKYGDCIIKGHMIWLRNQELLIGSAQINF